MNEQKNLLIVLGEWWQQSRANRREHRRSQWQRWLPSRGNVLFTLLVVAALLWAGSADALPLPAPAAAAPPPAPSPPRAVSPTRAAPH